MQIWGQGFFTWISGWIHAGYHFEARVSGDMCQISFLVKQNTFALNERNNLLQNIVSCQVDLIDKNPVSIFQRGNKISFHEWED